MTITEVRPALDLHAFREKARKLAQARQDARRDRERYAQQEAEAEHAYRKTLATVFAQQREKGEPVGASEIAARAAAADHAKTRDIAKSLVRSCDLRIEELEANRAMLRTDFESGDRQGLAA